MHSHSNLCHSNVSSTYYVSNLIFDKEKSIRYSRPRIFNVCEISTFQIRQNYPAPVGFLPEPDFCRIWKSAGFRPEPKSGTALIFSQSALLDSKNGFNYCTATGNISHIIKIAKDRCHSARKSKLLFQHLQQPIFRQKYHSSNYTWIPINRSSE